MEDFIKLLEDSISLKDEQLKITPEMELINDVGMTSLDMMVVVLEIEHKYNKKLPLEMLMEVKTVTDLYMLTIE
ncbi:acyl carrier protein [Oscillospiraceae bacterium HCP3S3_F4]